MQPDSSRRDPEFDAITEREIFEEARDRLQLAIDAETDDRNLAKEDLKFREGDQWDHDIVTTSSSETPELTINLTDMLCRRVVNNMKQQRPRGKAHPVGDGANTDTAELINGLGRHVEYRSEASVAYDTAGEMAVACGWGYARLIIEYVDSDSFEKDIRILPIRNIFTVYMDPAAIMPTACDADWCLITIMMKRAEYKRRFPSMDNVAWNDTGRDEWRAKWEDKEEIRLAEYFRIREKNEKLYRLRETNGTESTRFASDMPQDETLAAAGIQIVDERDSTRRQVEWFRLNGTRVIEREILPGTYIPVVRCEGNAVDIDGKVMRRGMVRTLSDAQRMVNYGEVAKIRRLGLTPQSPWVAAAGQTEGHKEWENANREPFPVMIYDPITVNTAQGDVLLPPPQRQPPAQLEAGFSEFTQGMKSNLLALAGMPQEPGQDKIGEVVSGKALQRRQALSDQSHFQYYDNQTLFIAQIWRIQLEWFPHVYTEPGRMQRIIGEDGVPEVVTLKQKDPEGKIKNDPSVGRYDVVMDTGPGYDTKREEGAETLLGLMQAPAVAQVLMNIAPDLIFRSIDHPYMQEIADRFSAMTPDGLKQVMAELPERARAIVQSLANQVNQLKQQLQQQASGVTKAHLAATVKAHDVEESNKTKRYDTDTRAATEIVTRLMEHGHEEKMAVHEAARLEREAQMEKASANGRTGQQ